MTNPDSTPSVPDPTSDALPDGATDATTQQVGVDPTAQHVPEPASGVRGADQVDAFDPEPGEGTTTGADGETAAREALRRELGERGGAAGDESDGGLEQTAALGSTDDPEGGSIQPHGDLADPGR
jgi:hypothetical protein